MPRPGRRPYECVKRAWHSERHQPIRGSLIQEIFRVVSKIHSSATKRNKEWQEKLPIVVLKAEEIMYSKANSEAEYMDFNTLWDRTNDAIDTIIRLDDSTETSDLLQPCIEAALQLGCIPRRASRSQRNSDPRCYLNPNPQEPMSTCHSSLKGSISSPQCMAMYSMYPLYNWSSHHSAELELRCNSFPPKTSTYATDKSHPASHTDAPNKRQVETISETPQTPPTVECDLSLRLGPCRGSEDIDGKTLHQEFRNAKSKNPFLKELHLFPNETAPKTTFNMDEASKKRKALTLTLPSNHFSQRMRNPGL
uniref:Histone acetyltransferase n=1 Tax=Kalanchoe fedtschenkoi TaxID=63787 RepID=A0A7N0VKI3_KALFE